jgi:hypothetical protein
MNGIPILCAEDIEGAPIVGCPQIGTGIVPCTVVTTVLAGFVPFFSVDGLRPLLQPFMAMTNGAPPGTIFALNDGGSAVQLGFGVPMPSIPEPIPPEKQYKEDKKKQKAWIEIELVGEDDKPVPNEWFRMEFPDGKMLDGALDGKGRCRLKHVPSGNCKVWFPNLDSEAVEPGSEG